MTTLYITRHGQTEWNLEGRMQGSKDSPLTKLGINQALQLGKRLKDTKIDIVYSSSSKRAFDTSKLIVGGRPLEIIQMDELKEMNFGTWEGMTFDSIKEEYPEQYNAFWYTPHLLTGFSGEGFQAFKHRVEDAINKIIEENQGKAVLVVAHGLVVKFLLGYFESTPLDKLFVDRIIQSASLSVVEVRSNKFEILKYGDTEHYSLQVDDE